MKLMHRHGITHLKVDGIELVCPNPIVPLKTQIMNISPKEIAAVQAKKPAFTKETSFDELDKMLFAPDGSVG
jgi:hypothetical protein